MSDCKLNCAHNKDAIVALIDLVAHAYIRAGVTIPDAKTVADKALELLVMFIIASNNADRRNGEIKIDWGNLVPFPRGD